MTPRANVDVIIIGGGIIGAATADQLAARGVRVGLVDRASNPGVASTAAAGILAAQIEPERDEALKRLLVVGRDRVRSAVPELEADTGVDVELQADGALYLIRDEAEVEHRRQIATTQRAEGLRVEWLAPEEIPKLEPEISVESFGGLYFPDDHRLNPTRLREALLKRATARGMVTLDDVDLSAPGGPTVVVAAGAWSTEVARGLGLPPIPVVPVRGQIVQSTPWDGRLRSTVFVRSLGYLLQRKGGRLIVGSSVEMVGFDATPTPDVRASLEKMARGALPGIRGISFPDTWAGFRPMTPDMMPILDAVDGNAHRVVVATGHFRSGIVSSLISGEIAAALALGESPSVDVTPFHLSRFDV
ncbi:MAG: FAD-dependent oxidoreductase [Deltaproteobacteria bacterium]|nr:FAD-dependent oxidoreductase [Deltaproteobacteria bacterium]